MKKKYIIREINKNKKIEHENLNLLSPKKIKNNIINNFKSSRNNK